MKSDKSVWAQLCEELRGQKLPFAERWGDQLKEADPLREIQSEKGATAFVNEVIKNTTPVFSYHPHFLQATELLLLSCVFFLLNECNREDLDLVHLARLLDCGLDETWVLIDGNRANTLDYVFGPVFQQASEGAAVQAYAAFWAAVENSIPKQYIIFDCLHRVYSYGLKKSEA